MYIITFNGLFLKFYAKENVFSFVADIEEAKSFKTKKEATDFIKEKNISDAEAIKKEV